MYRVLIADDEYLSRFVLKTIISKKIKNLEIVGEAENGRQAIEQNRELKPDLIIMDIKMPGINGIDATREIIKEFPDVSVLILTAYDNFDYIKQALDLGVKGYILKPVKEEEVIEKVYKVIKDIDERANKSDFKEQVETKIKVVKPLIENELISCFVSGNFDIDKVKNYINFLQVEIKAGYFMLISPGQSFSKSIDDAIRARIIKDKICTIAENHLPLMKRCYFGNSIGSTIIVFFPVKSEDSANEIYKEAVMIGNEIKSRIKVIEEVDVAVGIGSLYPEIENLYKGYDEANFALRKAIKAKKVLLFGNVDDDNAEDYQVKYPNELENKLVDQIKIGNMDNARQLTGEVIENIVSSNYKLESIKEGLTEFITVLKRTALKAGANPGNFGSVAIILELSDLNDLEEINLWCKKNIYSLLDLIGNKCGKNREIVNTVFDYINRHYNKDITLDSVAGEVGISPQYLSKIFKEKYGSNFIDYITKKRMEYAVELLSGNEISIKEVSKSAGYADPNYFCKIFKKETGYTPKQYRGQKITGEA